MTVDMLLSLIISNIIYFHITKTSISKRIVSCVAWKEINVLYIQIPSVLLKGLHRSSLNMLVELEFCFQMNTFLTRCQDSSLTEIKVHLFPPESVETGFAVFIVESRI
jgi:hypothetical protein